MGVACSEPEVAPLPRRLLLIGQSGAGKTQLLHTLKSDDSEATPTDGFNIEQVTSSSGQVYIIWDLSGAESFQLRHRQFYHGSDGLIFMVDSTKEAEKDMTKSHFTRLLMERDLSGLPFLVLVNKCDLSETASEEEWREILGLENITDRKWAVMTICARNKTNSQKAIDTLDNMFKNSVLTSSSSSY